MTPEEDPSMAAHLNTQEIESIQHYTHNSSRAFFWKQVAQYSLTAMGIFAGMGLGGGVIMSPDIAIGLAGACGAGGFGSSVVAHRIDLKNKLNLEELYARRSADSLASSMKENGVTQNIQPMAAGQFHDYFPTQQNENQPRPDITSAQLVAEKIISNIPPSTQIH